MLMWLQTYLANSHDSHDCGTAWKIRGGRMEWKMKGKGNVLLFYKFLKIKSKF